MRLQGILKPVAMSFYCMQMDFKGQWTMLMSILPDGAGAADMLCRILVAIDEDIVSLDIPRSPDGVKASMEFKAWPLCIPLLLPCSSHKRLFPAIVPGSGAAESY